MELQRCDKKILCDFYGCKNFATYTVKTKKAFLIKQMNFCEECLKEMYESIGKIIIPKAIEAPFKNKKRKVKGE